MICNLFSGSKLPFEGPHFPSDCILHGPHQHMRSCPAELRNSFCKSYRIAGDSMLEDRYSRDQQRSAELVTACVFHSLCRRHVFRLSCVWIIVLSEGRPVFNHWYHWYPRVHGWIWSKSWMNWACSIGGTYHQNLEHAHHILSYTHQNLDHTLNTSS